MRLNYSQEITGEVRAIWNVAMIRMYSHERLELETYLGSLTITCNGSISLLTRSDGRTNIYQKLKQSIQFYSRRFTIKNKDIYP